MTTTSRTGFIKCVDCGEEFTFTVGEQSSIATMG
jgi:hypothetical protein